VEGLGGAQKFSMSTTTNTPTPRCVLCCPRWAVLVQRYSFLSVSSTLLDLRFIFHNTLAARPAAASGLGYTARIMGSSGAKHAPCQLYPQHRKCGAFCDTSEKCRLCSLIPGLGVKLSANILAGPTVLSAVGTCPPHDGVRRRWWINVASAVSRIESSQKIGRSHHRHRPGRDVQSRYCAGTL
jgi:hypothetical protein